LQQTQTVYQEQNLSYQRSLRTPDLTISPNFDRNSNFAPNYFGMGISLPLPLINTNKGNIKSAEYSIKQQQSITLSAENELWNNINSAYHKLLMTIKQNGNNQKEFYTKYQAMYQNVLTSYQNKQISLLEFLDFFNDYTASQQRLLQQDLNLQLAKEELNFHTGVDLLK
jgi:cobalt-zinc-cadmium efflux system outer membrane protein